jgi:hypothetical protein
MESVWLPIEEAARKLGISSDAIRKRIGKGTAVAEKREGRWFIQLPADPAPESAPPASSPDASGSEKLAAHLSAEVEWLREELSRTREELGQRSRELAEERERFDVIHRLSLQRIEALLPGESAPPEAPGSPQTSDRDAERANIREEALPESRGFWRRLFG